MSEAAGPYYVVVTPARDAVGTIDETIESMLGQTTPPQRWVVVDDSSTDGTAELVRARTRDVPWIDVVERRGSTQGNFCSKVHAFDEGLQNLADVDTEFVVNLDADVSFGPDYFERLLGHFDRRPRLGVAAGELLVEIDGQINRRRTSQNSAAGAAQCFRRTCFDDVGGIPALRRGGEDSAAQITARSRGWEVETIRELELVHHGPVLNRQKSLTAAFWSRGIVNRSLGYDPLFQVAMTVYRSVDRPYVIGALAQLVGYAWAAIRREPLAIDPRAADHLRREQRDRLRGIVRRG